ncbi:MAG: aminofutalosine synthase MqnE [Candidatus Omnitrophica bacterium]|nr:aminofutalosine synthase MqnE [Candidatus Omnitrophota bacterium]MBI2174611.1 aminofutalosine synthase MqnE [Candidatus Omnitrophota bacterium]MBI3010185.1 aminofutalosine synthase MqnE [Candidatus Omnitrophota bacterium]
MLEQITSKIESDQRLTRQEALALFETDDIVGLGRLADEVKRSRWQDRVHFVVNCQINPSNICVLSCRFCDFATKRGKPNAYEMSIEEILSRCHADLREVHIVGGLHPDWKWSYYLDLFRAIKQNFPQIQIKAWTAVEIDYFSKKFRLPAEEVLLQLKEAGLSALPGGGAEVFSERIRKALFPFKIGAPRWLEIHRIAHRLQIPTNSTLLYGHMETYEERVEHMLRLRELQDETRGFMSFIPLAYQPGNTKIVSRQASAIEDLKTIAIARLLLDNMPHIKAYWVTIGEETVSMAVHWGADDIDGTIGEERIMHAANTSSPVNLTRGRLIELIRQSGCTPVERDALYNTVSIFDEQAHCENTVS